MVKILLLFLSFSHRCNVSVSDCILFCFWLSDTLPVHYLRNYRKVASAVANLTCIGNFGKLSTFKLFFILFVCHG